VPVQFGAEKLSGKGMSLTIGMGGMFIETDIILPYCFQTKVTCILPGYGEMVLSGIVTWRLTKPLSRRYKKSGFAIKFTEIRAEYYKKIEEYVSQKNRILREIKFLLSKDPPNMKRINELLTATYIKDYLNIKDLRQKIEDEIALSRLRVG